MQDIFWKYCQVHWHEASDGTLESYPSAARDLGKKFLEQEDVKSNSEKHLSLHGMFASWILTRCPREPVFGLKNGSLRTPSKSRCGAVLCVRGKIT